MPRIQMLPITRDVMQQQQAYAQQVLVENNLKTHLAARTLTLGAVFLIHAELIRQVVNLCFLTLLYTFSQPDPKKLDQQRVACAIAFAMWWECCGAVFSKNMLISSFESPPVPVAPKLEPAKVEVVVEGITPTPKIVALPPVILARATADKAVGTDPLKRLVIEPTQRGVAPPPDSPSSAASAESWDEVPLQPPSSPREAMLLPPPSTATPSAPWWHLFSYFKGTPKPAPIPLVPETFRSEEREEVVRKNLEKAAAALQIQFAKETVRHFPLQTGPTTYTDERGLVRWNTSHNILGGFTVGMCQYNDHGTLESARTQFSERFELHTPTQTYDVFIAGNMEALEGSKAALYLKNHFVKELSSLLHEHNLDELSVKGIWNPLNLVFGKMRTLYHADFSDGPSLNDKAFATFVMVLNGDVWTANLGGGAMLLNSKNEGFIQPLAIQYGNETSSSFSVSTCSYPQITITPVGQSRSIILVSSKLMQLGAHWVGQTVKQNQDECIETLAYNLVYTAHRETQAPHLSCMLIQIPSTLQAASGSGLHIATPSPASSHLGDDSDTFLEMSSPEAPPQDPKLDPLDAELAALAPLDDAAEEDDPRSATSPIPSSVGSLSPVPPSVSSSRRSGAVDDALVRSLAAKMDSAPQSGTARSPQSNSPRAGDSPVLVEAFSDHDEEDVRDIQAPLPTAEQPVMVAPAARGLSPLSGASFEMVEVGETSPTPEMRIVTEASSAKSPEGPKFSRSIDPRAPLLTPHGRGPIGEPSPDQLHRPLPFATLPASGKRPPLHVPPQLLPPSAPEQASPQSSPAVDSDCDVQDVLAREVPPKKPLSAENSPVLSDEAPAGQPPLITLGDLRRATPPPR